MRSILKHTLTAAACGAALSVSGSAAAKQPPGADPLPEGYVLVRENAQVTRNGILNGSLRLDDDTLLLHTTEGWFLVDVRGTCLRTANTPYGIRRSVRGTIDLRSRVNAGAHICGVRAVTQVERARG